MCARLRGDAAARLQVGVCLVGHHFDCGYQVNACWEFLVEEPRDLVDFDAAFFEH